MKAKSLKHFRLSISKVDTSVREHYWERGDEKVFGREKYGENVERNDVKSWYTKFNCLISCNI